MINQTDARAAWLEERRKGLGGSDIAAILGISPWQTPVSVWMDKTGRAAPKPETEAMRFGTAFEDYVAQRYTEVSGARVERYEPMLHKGCLLGNLDRLVIPEGEESAARDGVITTNKLLECKTGSRDWEDGIPLYYQTQVMHYMGLDERLEEADVAYLNRNYCKFEIYNIKRDDSVIAALQEKATEWWDKHIIHDIMPEPTNEEDCKLLWRRSAKGKKVVATTEVENYITELREIHGRLDEIKTRKAELESLIKAKFGDAEIMTDLKDKPIATWKSGADRNEVDYEAIVAEIGVAKEIIEKHTSVKIGSRRFSLKSA